jgi:hypothetical protein
VHSLSILPCILSGPDAIVLYFFFFLVASITLFATPCYRSVSGFCVIHRHF